MKVFISWSGQQSHNVAEALYKWLPKVLNEIEPWLSRFDINAGSIWYQEVRNSLKECTFGIVCLNPTNQNNSWLLYEAGALSISVDYARVVPYLARLRMKDVEGPLKHFQGAEANKEGTLALLRSLNSAVSHIAKSPKKDADLVRAYEKHWPELRSDLERILGSDDDRYSKDDERSKTGNPLWTGKDTIGIASSLVSLSTVPINKNDWSEEKIPTLLDGAKVAYLVGPSLRRVFDFWFDYLSGDFLQKQKAILHIGLMNPGHKYLEFAAKYYGVDKDILKSHINRTKDRIDILLTAKLSNIPQVRLLPPHCCASFIVVDPDFAEGRLICELGFRQLSADLRQRISVNKQDNPGLFDRLYDKACQMYRSGTAYTGVSQSKNPVRS